LGTVVEVTLDAAELCRGVVDRLGPGLGDVGDALLELVTRRCEQVSVELRHETNQNRLELPPESERDEEEDPFEEALGL
jgi:hypothetical protein